MSPSADARHSLLTLQNILPIQILAQTDQFLRFTYKNTVFAASALTDGISGMPFLALDVELCAADHPSLPQAMLGMMRANFDMSHLSINSVTFGLRPSSDGAPAMLCLTVKHEQAVLSDLDWPVVLDQLVNDSALFEQAKAAVA